MRKALGRGLESLIPDKGEEILHVDIEKIFPSPDQPRKVFENKALEELAQSIKEKGVIQPIIVHRIGNGTFNLVAGERRWRASNIAGLNKIPCIVKEEKPDDSLEIALIENIQRENLNPVETAEAFHRLTEEFNLKHEDVANKVGKDRATVSNYLRILNLPDEVKNFINEGKLNIGHAKALLSIDNKADIINISNKIIKNSLSVRETEKLCKRTVNVPRGTLKTKKDPQIASLENELMENLGTKVKIINRGQMGKIEIEYYSLDELNKLIDVLRK